MRFGMNLLLWSGELNDSLVPVLEMLKRIGFDGVEFPLFNLSLDYAAWGRRLDDLGLRNANEAFWDAVRGNLERFEDVALWYRVCFDRIEPRIEDAGFAKAAVTAFPDGAIDLPFFN